MQQTLQTQQQHPQQQCTQQQCTQLQHPSPHITNELQLLPHHAQQQLPADIHSKILPSIPQDLFLYWDSPEAKKFFGWSETVGEDAEVSVREIISERIVRLRKGALTNSGWRDVLDNGDIGNKCGAPFIMLIQQKCKFLPQALSILYKNQKKNSNHGAIAAKWQYIE